MPIKKAIILHGMPSREEYFNPQGSQHNKHWLPWLQKQLSQNGIEASIPNFPEPYEPNYEKWKSVFEQFEIDKDTLLIGHSCGGGFLVRWLSENNVKVHKVALIAPWIDPNHKFAPEMFSDWEVKDITTQADNTRLFISMDDDKEELDTAEKLKQTVTGLEIQEFKDRGHFTFEDMKTGEFPELFEFLIN